MENLRQANATIASRFLVAFSTKPQKTSKITKKAQKWQCEKQLVNPVRNSLKQRNHTKQTDHGPLKGVESAFDSLRVMAPYGGPF